MDRSPSFGSMTANLCALFRLGFPSTSKLQFLNLAYDHNSLARSTKSTVLQGLLLALPACRHRVSGSISLPFRGSFHLSLTVLYSIGHQVVFSLRRWASLIPTGLHVSDGTRLGTKKFQFRLPDCHRLWFSFPENSAIVAFCCSNLGFSPFARRYLGNRGFFLFVTVLRCFSSRTLASHCYVFTI